MTFNVLCAGRGENHWCRRQSAVCGIIKSCSPDFFGIQEAHFGWMRCIAGKLGDTYAYVGIGKDDGNNKGEFSPVFYKKDIYEIVERLIKTILWVAGGYKIYISGDKYVYENSRYDILYTFKPMSYEITE